MAEQRLQGKHKFPNGVSRELCSRYDLSYTDTLVAMANNIIKKEEVGRNVLLIVYLLNA
jgi:hypothetical protein